MGDAGRQVEHVAGIQQGFVIGAKAREDLERDIGFQREVALPAQTPSPLPLALEQKYVIRIEMRPDAASGRGVAHHEIVEPRIRDKGESAEQRIGRGNVEVYALDQQRPVALG